MARLQGHETFTSVPPGKTRETVRIRCRDCKQSRYVLPTTRKRYELTCDICGDWMHRATSTSGCPSCRFDRDYHNGGPFQRALQQRRSPPAADDPLYADVDATMNIALPSDQAVPGEADVPEASEVDRVLAKERDRTLEAERVKTAIVSGDTAKRAGSVTVGLYFMGWFSGALISDLCLRACPTGVVPRFLTYFFGYGANAGQWLLPGEGGLHEVVDVAAFLAYLYVAGLVIVAIYKALITLTRRVS